MKPIGVTRVAIVGGGVAGLAAGVELARRGCDVRLYEARDVVGGCASTTDVDGFRFNDGALFVALPRLLDHAFARLGLDRAARVPLLPIAVPQASWLPDGTRVTLGARGAAFVDGAQGAERSAVLQAEIARCVGKWRPLLRIFVDDLLIRPLSLPHFLAKTWRHLPKLRGTLAAELARDFSDPDARAALAAVTLYTGLPAECTPVAQIVGLIALLDDGLYLPEGGMGAIPRALAGAFAAHGGQVRTGAAVARIRVAGGRVRGLTLASGEQIDADAVVSTASGMATFARLVEAADAPRAMLRRVARAPLSHRALGIQLGLRNRIEPVAYSVNHLPSAGDQRAMLSPQPDGVRWLNYTVPTVTLPGLAPPGGSIVEMFAAVDARTPLDAWTDAAKTAAAQPWIDALARRHRLDIATLRVTGPKDHAERLGLYEGALYGLSPAARPDQQFPHVTPIDGLYLAGQTTYPGFGVTTSMLSGVFAADALASRALR
ncbi:NAD(P)/FAD-dependent oxidoreductase [Burkholderia oklahomensis]|uniref:phytoene desaturase family protein n=1 Tax=Burkholderia oklahomensis TaxID=342113 RepID=UPI002650732E|nr:NAD(P)/FAD-dependent oxidoreductase [Burkholderia oklahomensis]MDN7676123.1 NAD(P)/FAD-dependent oxidoreductase [Burkholderia oklahomensis]